MLTVSPHIVTLQVEFLLEGGCGRGRALKSVWSLCVCVCKRNTLKKNSCKPQTSLAHGCKAACCAQYLQKCSLTLFWGGHSHIQMCQDRAVWGAGLTSANREGKGGRALCWSVLGVLPGLWWGEQKALWRGVTNGWACTWPKVGRGLHEGTDCLSWEVTLARQVTRGRKWKLLSPVQLFVTPMDYTDHGILQARILE